MSLKSILAVTSGEQDDAALLRAAASLAVRMVAHVNVIPAFADPAADYVAYGASLRPAGPAAGRIADSERAAQERLEVLAREIAAETRASIHVEKRALQPAVALAFAAVLADVVLFSAGAARSPTLGPLFAETLLSTRAPVMLVRGGGPRGGPAAIAWDGSAQAGHAVRAALPLLQTASGVLILRNIDDVDAEDDAGERLRAYLAAHGITNVAARHVHGESVAASVLAAAQADKCDLLVAGAYGRPRFFEMVLGGATRAFAHAAQGPSVLLAH